MRIKFGLDPTGKTIHLGRTIPLLKLKEYQDNGEQIVLIIGDFTATIGDASDKTNKRPQVTKKDIQENLKDYIPLIGKILDIEKCEIHYHSEWFNKMTVSDFLELQELFTVQQMTNRRNFAKRIENNKPVSLREIIYPILQGYDSYIVNADIEIGGEDQIFNMLLGRDIQKHFGQKQQEVITTPMLLGTDGKKMSTSEGNVINITDEPKEMFDKILSIKDELMIDYIENVCIDFLQKGFIKQEVKEGRADYRKFKEIMANEIIKMYK